MAMFKITNIIVLLIVFLVTATFVNCDELVEFLTEVGSFLEHLQRNYRICDINGMEYDIRKLEQYIEIFAALLSVLLTIQEAPLLLTRIVSDLANSLRKSKFELFKKLSDHMKYKDQVFVCETEVTGGRPKFVVTREQIVVLRDTGMTWSDISKCLCISPKTLYRRRQEYDIPNSFANISDAELDDLLSNVLALTPNAGETYVTGGLRARGILVQRWRIRNRLKLLDPVGRAIRKHKSIIRRVYNVSGANHLWHIDSNHKLIGHRFVIHGCVDGFSRTVIYLKCANNNLAATALGYFLEGTAQFGLPMRVRGDRGVENVDIARYMIHNRGLNEGRFIVGRSVHNTRIERLWADVNRVVISYYAELFRFMENNNLLDSTNELHLFALSCVYLSRINRSLAEFTQQINYHGLSSVVGHKSPLALWHESLVSSNGDVLVDNPDVYGIDYQYAADEIIDEENIVRVPDSNYHVSDATFALILRNFSPLVDDGNHGINCFTSLIAFLETNGGNVQE